MKNRTINNVVTILLMIVSIAVMFSGWITIDDSYTRRSLRNNVEDIQDEIRDVDDTVIDGIDFALDKLDVPVSVNKIFSFIEEVLDILEDAALSPVEYMKIGKAWISNDITLLLSAIDESSYSDWVVGRDAMRFLDGFGGAGTAIVLLGVIMAMHIFVTVVALIRQLVKPNAKSIFFMLSAFLVTVWNCVAIYLFNDSFEIYAEDFLDMDKLFAGTFASFVPAIVAVLVLVNQFMIPQFEFGRIGMSIGSRNTGAFRGAGNTPYAMPQMRQAPLPKQAGAATSYCPVCGAGMSKDAAFCPGCGAFVAKPEPIVKTCKGCGMALDTDSVFCPNCGVKNE